MPDDTSFAEQLAELFIAAGKLDPIAAAELRDHAQQAVTSKQEAGMRVNALLDQIEAFLAEVNYRDTLALPGCPFDEWTDMDLMVMVRILSEKTDSPAFLSAVGEIMLAHAGVLLTLTQMLLEFGWMAGNIAPLTSVTPSE